MSLQEALDKSCPSQLSWNIFWVLSTNSQGTEKCVEGVDGQKKNMTFEKREIEGVRTIVPCVIRAQSEMKEWRQRRRVGCKEQSWSSIHYLRCLYINNMVPSSAITKKYSYTVLLFLFYSVLYYCTADIKDIGYIFYIVKIRFDQLIKLKYQLVTHSSYAM